MKGGLDYEGKFFIERKEGVFRLQGCPYTEGTDCGDWCPMMYIVPEKKLIRLYCCNRVFTFEDLLDRRGSDE